MHWPERDQMYEKITIVVDNIPLSGKTVLFRGRSWKSPLEHQRLKNNMNRKDQMKKNSPFNNISVIYRACDGVSFIGEGKRSTQRKPLTCCKLLTNFITEIMSRIQIGYSSKWKHEVVIVCLIIVCRTCFLENIFILFFSLKNSTKVILLHD
jgi:hypothetical protein